MKSMTGFGHAQEKSEKLEISVTIKAVNGRYLDVRPHIPASIRVWRLT